MIEEQGKGEVDLLQKVKIVSIEEADADETDDSN